MAKRKKMKLTIGIQDSISPAKQVIWLAVLTILFFLAVCFSVNATIKTTVLILLCLTLLGGIFCFPTIRSRIKLPLIVLLLIVLMGGISTSYALSGKFALYEFLKLVSALCIALLLLMLTPGEGVAPGRRIATILEGGAALISLFSVDLISTRLLSTPLLTLLGNYSSDYQDLPGVEVGTRITSIFTNPNIFAGCVGIGVLLALSLSLSAQSKGERRFHLCCLYITSTAFVLAFSMGATAAIAVAFVVYLLLEHKDRRSDLLLLMIETLILAAASVALTSMTSFDAWDGFQPTPLLCLIIGSFLLCLADQFVGQKLAAKLHGHGKMLLIVILIIIIIIAIFALTAYNFTGSISLNNGESLSRSVYPAPGEYTLSVQGSAGVQVTIESQNRQDTMMHTSTVLFKGALQQAAFTVPEDSLVVHFYFQATENATLDSVEYVSAESSGFVPLDYKLLPGFIANRLQGLRANQNAIQRLVFFEDGIKLFKESPIIGLGLGAFENAIYRVQSFFYETKYVHNHYIQTLLETGIIGLLLFIGLLVISAVCILLSRKKENFHPLVPALGALLVFMAVHGATEVVFSSYPYLPLAFGVFTLINLCCGEAIPTPWLGKKVRSGIAIGAAALMLVFAVLLGNNMSARNIADKYLTFDALERAVSLDKFEWADYALSYVMSSTANEVPDEIMVKADEYAEKLAQENSNTIPLHLTDYYFSIGNVERAMEMAEKYVSYISANSDAWNNLILLVATYEQPSEAYYEGVTRIAQILEQWNSEHIGTIELNATAQGFLDRILVQ